MELFLGTASSFDDYVKNRIVEDKDAYIWLFQIWDDYKNYMDTNVARNWESNKSHLTSTYQMKRRIESCGLKIKSEKKYCEYKSRGEMQYSGIRLKDEIDYKKELGIETTERAF